MQNKHYIILLILICSFKTFSSEKRTDIYLGYGYNQFSLDEINEISSEEVDNGMSYNLGIRARIFENIKIGVELDSLEAEWSDLDYKAASMGTLLMIEYELLSGPSYYGENVNSSISLYGGIGVYNSGIYYDNSDLLDEETESGMGYKGGVQYKADFSDFFGIQFRIGYRQNNIEINSSELDFSGLNADLGLVLSI